MLTALAGFQLPSWADEPVKLASASTNTTSSVITTNSIEPAAKAFNAHTNSASGFAGTISGSGTTNEPLSNDLSSPASVTVVIEKTPEGGPFSGQRGNGNFGFANIEAGYGQAYDADSIVLRGRNGTAWEENRYVFFKKVVKF